jgi:hypothetical protein
MRFVPLSIGGARRGFSVIQLGILALVALVAFPSAPCHACWYCLGAGTTTVACDYQFFYGNYDCYILARGSNFVCRLSGGCDEFGPPAPPPGDPFNQLPDCGAPDCLMAESFAKPPLKIRFRQQVTAEARLLGPPSIGTRSVAEDVSRAAIEIRLQRTF